VIEYITRGFYLLLLSSKRVDMEYRQFKVPSIILGVVTLVYFTVEYFGIIAFFSFAMWLLIPLVLITKIYVFVSGVRFAFRSLRNKKFISFLMGLLFAISGFIIFRFGYDVHLVGLTRKFKLNDARLTEACQKILIKTKPNEYFWDDNFNLWPAIIGPTRKAIFHFDEVVYISFEGGPGIDAGVCYNPHRRKTSRWSAPLPDGI